MTSTKITSATRPTAPKLSPLAPPSAKPLAANLTPPVAPRAKVSGLLPVIAAFIGNFVVCIAKFAGFFVSGSGAMFSEAIHSFADTANQLLLVIGVRKSVKKPDKDFNYGYGKERFIWAMISACGIFFIGCGVTVYHGLMSFVHEPAIHFSFWVIGILAFSFIIE